MIAPNKRYPFFRKDMRVRIKVPDLGLPVGSTGTVQSVTSGRIVIVRWDDGQTFGGSNGISRQRPPREEAQLRAELATRMRI